MDDPRKAARRSYVLLITCLVFAFQFVDRQLIAILAQPIKREFLLSDSQVGLLTGFIFSIPYALMILPIGYLVDRYNRRNLLALALAIWSLLTFATGFVRSFPQLLATRVAIAAAESANNPTALSLLSDYFGKDRRATAVGIFFSAPGLGSAAAFTLVAYFAQRFGWRTAFFLAGAPGLVLAALLYFTVREPNRELIGRQTSRAPAPSLRETFAFMVRQRSLVQLLAAMTFGAMAISANLAWLAPFLMRVHHFSLTESAATISIGHGLCAAIGQILGGPLVLRWARYDKANAARGCAVAAVLAFLFMFASAIAPWSASIPLLIAAWAIPAALPYGPAGGAILTLVIPRMRGIIASLYSLMLNLIGFGVGPFIVGVLSDRLQDRLADRSLQAALAVMASFQLASSVHFVLAARHINADLESVERYGE